MKKPTIFSSVVVLNFTSFNIIYHEGLFVYNESHTLSITTPLYHEKTLKHKAVYSYHPAVIGSFEFDNFPYCEIYDEITQGIDSTKTPFVIYQIQKVQNIQPLLILSQHGFYPCSHSS